MPPIGATLTSTCCVVFAFFALSASGMFGDPDVPLLVLVGLVAAAVVWTLAAKRRHVTRLTLARSPHQVAVSDAQDQIRMDSDKV
jgi:hypothetical protein